jgi:hypothetical protein
LPYSSSSLIFWFRIKCCVFMPNTYLPPFWNDAVASQRNVAHFVMFVSVAVTKPNCFPSNFLPTKIWSNLVQNSGNSFKF